MYVPLQASVHTAKNKLTKNVQEKGLDPAEFRKTYMSLKTKQLFELDPYTYFLGKVSYSSTMICRYLICKCFCMTNNFWLSR